VIIQDQTSLKKLAKWLKKDDSKGKSREVKGRAGQITTARKLIQELILKLQQAFTDELTYVRSRRPGEVKYGTDLKKVMIDLMPELKPEDDE
jgi:hypothetical protein